MTNPNAVHVRCCLLLICLLIGCVPAVYGQPARRQTYTFLYPVSARDSQTGEMRFGFIDKSGKLIVGYDQLPKNTVAVDQFHEGRALIYVQQTKSQSGEYSERLAGYIDETGTVVIPAVFDVAHPFSEGLAYVESNDGVFKGFIDRTGTRVITVNGKANDFNEGLAAVQSADAQTWGYIDRSGRSVVRPQYEFADDFSEGLAGIVINGKYGFINKQGRIVIQPRFDVRRSLRHPEVFVSTGRFRDGMAPVRVNRLYGYINQRGEFVVKPRFFTAQEFSEGLALVVEMDEITSVVKRAGWIDKSGRYAIAAIKGHSSAKEFARTFSDPNGLRDWRFSEGLAPFDMHRNGKYVQGYIDRQGVVVVEPRPYDRLGRFIGGIARVQIRDFGTDQAYGYIDRQGRFIWRSK